MTLRQLSWLGMTGDDDENDIADALDALSAPALVVIEDDADDGSALAPAADVISLSSGDAEDAAPPMCEQERIWRHTSAMRIAKLKKAKQRVRPRVQKHINQFNATVTRHRERVDLDAGPGRSLKQMYNKLTPVGILRCCWSQDVQNKASMSQAAKRMRKRRAVYPKRLNKRRRADPTSRSVTAVADYCKASTTYVGKVRNAVSDLILERERSLLQEVCGVDHAICEIAFDETEQTIARHRQLVINGKAKVKRCIRVVPVMVTHATLTLCLQTGAEVLPITMAPAVLRDTRASTIWQAISDKLPIKLASIREKAGVLVIVMCSDSAKACHAVYRILASTRQACQAWSLHAVCMLHQLSLCVNACFGPLNIIGPVFCGSTLMRKSSVQESLSKRLDDFIAANLEIEAFAPPLQRDQEYAAAVMKLLEWTRIEGDAVQVSSARCRLRRSFAALCKFLTSPWDGDRLVHHCPLGCCRDEAESRQKLRDLFDDILLCRLPPVPACNRWTKLYPAVAWWTVSCLICNVIPRLWITMGQSAEVREVMKGSTQTRRAALFCFAVLRVHSCVLFTWTAYTRACGCTVPESAVFSARRWRICFKTCCTLRPTRCTRPLPRRGLSKLQIGFASRAFRRSLLLAALRCRLPTI